MKRLLMICAALTAVASSYGITPSAMNYGRGLTQGLQIASAYVDANAPDWTTDFADKSDAEFQLLALKQTYAMESMGEAGEGTDYEGGVSAGIQAYINWMNSVGYPVWFTGGDGASVSTPASPRLAPTARVRRALVPASLRRPAE